jgi:hypothetical protein
MAGPLMATRHGGLREATALRAGVAESRFVAAVSSAVTAACAPRFKSSSVGVTVVARRRCRRPTAHQHRRIAARRRPYARGPLGGTSRQFIIRKPTGTLTHRAVTSRAQGVGGTTQGIHFLHRVAAVGDDVPPAKSQRSSKQVPEPLAERAYFDVTAFPSGWPDTFQSATRRRAASSWTVFSTRCAAACSQQKR